MVDTKDQSMQCIVCCVFCVCQHCWYWCLWLLHNPIYSVYRGPWPLREGRLTVALSPVGLAVHQSEEAALLTFWDLSTTRVIAGRTHSQFLKTKGVLSNPVILTDQWEQSYILHTLTKTPCLLYKFRSENVFFNSWRMAASEVVWALACSVFGIVGLYKQIDMPNLADVALKPVVPTAPNLPETNCSYLAIILSAKELNSLYAC